MANALLGEYVFTRLLSPYLAGTYCMPGILPDPGTLVGTQWGKKERKENYHVSSDGGKCHFSIEIVGMCY